MVIHQADTDMAVFDLPALSQSGVAEADVATQLGKLLSAKAKELGVKINPRYGFWDTEAGDVVAADVTGGAVTPSAE